MQMGASLYSLHLSSSFLCSQLQLVHSTEDDVAIEENALKHVVRACVRTCANFQRARCVDSDVDYTGVSRGTSLRLLTRSGCHADKQCTIRKQVQNLADGQHSSRMQV